MMEKDKIDIVRKEAEDIVKKYMSENEIGFEDCVYNEMKKIFNELGIKWNPFKNDTVQ